MLRKKSFGQHFISNARVLDAEASLLQEGASVLEIGGGDGRLSERVAKRASVLYVVEKDGRFVSVLRDKFKGCAHVHIIHNDFLALDPSQYDIDYIVGNIPYYISSQVTFKLLDWQFRRAYIMYQKEFADKLIATGNKRSRLSFFSNYYFTIKKLFKVPKEVFSPKPKVDSVLVEISKKKVVRLDARTQHFITKLFQHRLKSLKSTIKMILKQNDATNLSVDDICASSGVDCSLRVFELGEKQIIKLGRILSSLLP